MLNTEIENKFTEIENKLGDLASFVTKMTLHKTVVWKNDTGETLTGVVVKVVGTKLTISTITSRYCIDMSKILEVYD